MKRLFVLSLTMVSVSLTGCLGSSGSGPDEMSVIDGAPLSLPPNFELRPPQKGKTVDRAKQTEESRRLLLGTSEKKEEAKTTEGWLVQQAGGDKRDESIREKLESEDGQALVKEADKGFFSKLFSNDQKNGTRAAKKAKEEAEAAAEQK